MRKWMLVVLWFLGVVAANTLGYAYNRVTHSNGLFVSAPLSFILGLWVGYQWEEAL